MPCIAGERFILVRHSYRGFGWGVRDRELERTAFYGFDFDDEEGYDYARGDAEDGLASLRWTTEHEADELDDALEDHSWEDDADVSRREGVWSYGMPS